MPELAPQHASFLLSKDSVIMEALAPCELILPSGKKNLESGQRVTLELKDRTKWEIVFPNQTKITCKIYDEMFPVASEIKKSLESEYGKLQKIWESQSFWSLKSQDGKALKVLQPTYFDKERVANRFGKAAKSFQKLPADQFLEITKIECDSVDKPCYVEMKYLQGEILGNYLAKQGVLPLEEAKRLVKEIALRLSVLQDHGYSVRNLNPQNIIIGKDGKLRLTGFLFLKDYNLNMTQADDQMIIPNYSSPEQMQDPSKVDVYSDVFSLGATFYSLLLGESLYNASNATQYMLQLTSAESVEPTKIQAIAPDLDFSLCKMIADMLCLDQGKRPAPKKIVAFLSGSSKDTSTVEKKTEQGFFSRLFKRT
jgi:serine/threonine protein kinase